MPSIGSMLSIARTAISAHQAAIQVVSHNIANAETEGYSRQRAEMAAGYPLSFPYGTFGTGVDISNVTRARSEILDSAYQRQAGAAEGYGLRRDLLEEIQGIFGEPSENGLTATLDAFWDSWSDLSNNPGSPIAQGAVRQRGIQVAQTLRGFDARLTEIGEATRGRLTAAVDELNALATQVAELNVRILAAESGGNQAPDLRDERDRIADRMARLGGTRAFTNADGTMTVALGGATLVDQATARPLRVSVTPVPGQPGDPRVAIHLGDSPDAVPGIQGTLGAMVGVLVGDPAQASDASIPGIRRRLNELARGVVNGVNFLHERGWTAAGDALSLAGRNWDPLNGPTGSGVSFFDASGTTAATMSLSSHVLASPAVIASGQTQNGPGDNALALAMGALRDGAGMSELRSRMGDAAFAAGIGFVAGQSFNDQYRRTVTDVGLELKSTQADATIHEALARQADTRRQSVSGVSIDEELTLLMRHQQAFTAASRLVNVADEMAQAILEMV